MDALRAGEPIDALRADVHRLAYLEYLIRIQNDEDPRLLLGGEPRAAADAEAPTDGGLPVPWVAAAGPLFCPQPTESWLVLD